jgi:hypothetical protein
MLTQDLTQALVWMVFAFFVWLVLRPVVGLLRVPGGFVVTTALSWIMTVWATPLALDWAGILLRYLNAAGRHVASS